MAYDKVVDSAKLDADLKTVADAIRAKAGTTGEMAFPNGYVSALEPLVNGEDYLGSVINKTCTELVNRHIKELVGDFQRGNTKLTKVILGSCEKFGASLFNGCGNVTVFEAPALKTISSGSFEVMRKMKSFYFPSLETISGWGYNFNQCSGLERVYLPKLTGAIGSGDFAGCTSLKALILGADTVVTLSNVSAFGQTPITNGGDGYVYVKAAYYDQYLNGTNWSAINSQIRKIEDYPEVLEGWE